MYKLKKIDIYVLKRFLTLFSMTFLICILILLMQFLWKHFADLVGKGIGFDVISEFFLYATFTLIPMALPLAILLASIMTFGNLGESYELTAIKSAGISLFRIMRGLIFFILTICIAAFFFSNYVLPVSQTKLWTLVLSLKQKSPELDIPTGEFCTQINGLNIYVRDKEDGLLKDLMIYDFSNGFDNATVMVADSGRVQLTADKKYLMLSLYEGESFENLKDQQISTSSSSIPYRREIFSSKEILIDFNSDFTRLDESILEDQHMSKNIQQLERSIDSVSILVNKISKEQAYEMTQRSYFGREKSWGTQLSNTRNFNTQYYNSDSIFENQTIDQLKQVASLALQKATDKKNQIDYNKYLLTESRKYVSRHQIEWHRKFTLSFACLIFFFIGAPLGAIIRKGGLGTPVVISVLLFIAYYIIDNSGFKMAREGIWSAFEGMWLSSSILLPIGIYLTYKAAIDGTLFSTIKIQKYIQTHQPKIKQAVSYISNTSKRLLYKQHKNK